MAALRAGHSHNRMKLQVGDSDSTIFPLLQLDWQSQIDQSCLEERQREHVARMHMERIIERIAAALLELEMSAVAPAAEVWAKVDPFEQSIRLRGRARYAVVVVEAAVGKWSAQPFVEEQKKQRDLNTL
jgi:hypothetical protein